MKTQWFWLLGTMSVLALGGCNKAESPAKVQNDVAQASDTAANNDAKAAGRQAKAEASATRDVNSAELKADTQTAAAAADTAAIEAEGNNKVALAKCESLSGDLQQACKDKANTTLEMAKAKAKQLKAEHP